MQGLGSVSHELQLVLNFKVHTPVTDFHFFDHPEMDKLVRKFEVTTDRAEREKLVKR